MMSSGSSRWVAPGFSAAAMLNALRTASATMRGWWRRVFHLVMGRSISTVSMNWCVVSLCMPARPVWPVSATSGAWSSVASPMPVARLLAPGPRVARQTPGLPVSRPYASAMKAAPCSCRVGTKVMSCERSSASLRSSVSSPGMPKTNSTPSFSRQSTKRSAAVRWESPAGAGGKTESGR